MILKILLVGVLLVFGVTFIYEQYSRYSTKKELGDGGTYADIGGYKLHYVKKGKKEPAVIFEAGLDLRGHHVWNKVQNEVSQFATTVSYDRAGILNSQRGDKEKSCKNMAYDLHMMLEKIQTQKPYILVAHSLGGLVIRAYVKEYPDEVKGVVLVDSTHPEQIEKAPEEFATMMKTPQIPGWLTKFLSIAGVTRIGISYLFNSDSNNSKELKNEINANLDSTISSVFDEMKNLEYLMKEVKGITFGDIPLTIIGSTKSDNKKFEPFKEYLRSLQENNLELSTHSNIIWAENSGHFIQLEQPELVIEAIKKISEL